MNLRDLMWFIKAKIVYTSFALAIALTIGGILEMGYVVIELSSDEYVGEEFFQRLVSILISTTVITAGYLCWLLCKSSYDRWFKKKGQDNGDSASTLS